MATEGRPLDSLCYHLTNLTQLARQGSWRALIDSISEARKLSLPHFPHEQLIHHAFLVLSHMKLRNYGDASLELDALADLDSPQYQYQHYPDLYPRRTGSMVPFVLRWLYAELPAHLNQHSLAFERLYTLYDLCQQRIDRVLALDVHTSEHAGPQAVGSSQPNTSDLHEEGHLDSIDDSEDKAFSTSVNEHGDAESDSEFGGFVSGVSAALDEVEKSMKTGELNSTSHANLLKRWQLRREFIINCIICHHLHQKDFVVVFKWFKELQKIRPSDPWLLSKLGYVQTQMGDLNGGRATFSEVEGIITKMEANGASPSPALKGLICRNRGLQHVVLKQYTEAVKEFDAAVAMDPMDVLSANNKALCYMYSRDLIGSTKVLESILDKAPLLALNESLVLNLCSMYELAFVHNVQTKKNLSDWIQQIAPGDFDFSCTRL